MRLARIINHIAAVSVPPLGRMTVGDVRLSAVLLLRHGSDAHLPAAHQFMDREIAGAEKGHERT